MVNSGIDVGVVVELHVAQLFVARYTLGILVLMREHQHPAFAVL